MDPRKLQPHDLFFSARKRVLSGSGLCVLGSLVVLFCLVSVAAPPTFSSPIFSWFSSVSDYALPPSEPQTFEVSILEGEPPAASNSVTNSDLLKTHLGDLEEGDQNSRNPMNVEKTLDGDPPTASIPVTKPDLLKTRVGDLAEGDKDSRNPVNVVKTHDGDPPTASISVTKSDFLQAHTGDLTEGDKDSRNPVNVVKTHDGDPPTASISVTKSDFLQAHMGDLTEGDKDSRNPVNVVKTHDGDPPTASISVTKSDFLQAHTGDLAEGDEDSRNPKNVNKTLNGFFSENSSGGRDPGLTKNLEGNWSLNSSDPPTSSFIGGEPDESKHQLKGNGTLENSDPPTSSFNGGEADELKHQLNTSTGDSHNSGIFVNSTTSERNPHGKDASVSSSHNIKENPNIVQSNEKKETDGKGKNDSTGNSFNSTTVKGSSEKKKCDIFDGRWVRDERGPLYPAGSCPFIDNDFNCYKNGRPDDGFSKWRWQPKDCDIPRLNATDFLERLRGKRIIFVGDSLNRNMWESMVCILRNNIRDKSRVYELSGRSNFKTSGYYTFRFEDYNCSVDYVRSTFLVKEIYHKNKNGSEDEKLRLDLIDETTTAYREAKVIVFNTGHWWTHEKTSKGIEYYQEGNYVYPVLKPLEAYKKALETWGKWVDNNIDSNRSRVIFRGYSPSHFRGGRWNSGGQCHKESEPIFNESYLTKYPSKARALEQVMKQMRTPVTYLNISRLTDFRKDGHPSIYRKTYQSVEEQIAAEKSQDCSHWCLPGIPDTWNELLYASLTMDGQHSL